MLVLSRKKDEVILVGNNIRIVIVDVAGGKARIGIQAPADVAILREELVPASVEPLIDEPHDILGE